MTRFATDLYQRARRRAGLDERASLPVARLRGIGKMAAFAAAIAAGPFATRLLADNPFTSSPQGDQNVLVILARIPTDTNPCPPATGPCQVTDLAEYGAPRHTTSEWENILNNAASTYWRQTTYGLTNFHFTVPTNPNSADGWWPVPHSLNEYYRNGDAFTQKTNTPPTYAIIPDATASAVNGLCGNPIFAFVCGFVLPTFNRLVVMTNHHKFGGVTYGNDLPLSIPIGDGTTKLLMSATWVDEDASDGSAVAVLMHELGHQLGIPSHYGNCFLVFDFSQVPTDAFLFFQTRGVGCLGIGWDIMGLSPSFAQLSGYSRVSRGWIGLEATLSYDLLQGPFSQNVFLNPVESPPFAGLASVIRLSGGDLSWPAFFGDYVECRRRIAGEAGLAAFPGIGGLSDEGVLITSIHEFFTPPMHIERSLVAPGSLMPEDQIAKATLKAGDVFTRPYFGLSVRFNGFTDGGACSISIANLRSLPPPPNRLIRFAGSALPNGLGQTRDTGSISVDIGLDNVIAASPVVQTPIPVAPPWVGHGNVISVRVHNRSAGPVQNVAVGVSAVQPAVIRESCSAAPAPAMGSVLPNISAASSAVAVLGWTPLQGDSVSIDAVATGPANQITTSTRFAFQSHHVGSLAGGVRSQFVVAADSVCSAPETFFLDSGVSLPGWQVSIAPSYVTLNPGQSATVDVLVTPPPSEPGEHAEIPILVRTAEVIPVAGASLHPQAGQHLETVGALTILARVTSGPGAIGLNVPAPVLVNSSAAISGSITPADVNSPITIEYRSPSGKTTTHVALTDGRGVYTDSFSPNELGVWTVQSRWPGDNAYDPAESAPATFLVFALPAGGLFVIGDKNAVPGNTVTFWGAQWPFANTLSGGSAPIDFKGFANNPTTLPGCGGSWSSNPGNSSSPPNSVPSYMAVIVTSSISQFGSLDSGKVAQLAVVQTDSGYRPDVGHTGTGKVLEAICK